MKLCYPNQIKRITPCFRLIQYRTSDLNTAIDKDLAQDDKFTLTLPLRSSLGRMYAVRMRRSIGDWTYRNDWQGYSPVDSVDWSSRRPN